jgi:undecaprenyl-diphosphatase
MGLGYILKSSIRRLRPFQQEPTVIFKSILYTIQNNYATWNFSFPSFHAMFVFSLLPLLNKQYSKFKYVWIIFAILVAFSRVYLGVHYLSDVLAGAIIGYLIGVSALWIEERYEIGYIIMKGLRVSK